VNVKYKNQVFILLRLDHLSLIFAKMLVDVHIDSAFCLNQTQGICA
jgi:hypothetical protein